MTSRMRYLNPKADLTFKKVFGEHPNLIKSLLNALLPFERPEEEIDEIEYLAPELVPDTPLKKNSIVDVRCKDRQGRQFIVEMQMLWSPAFMQRVLFNASKAYVRQLGGTGKYELLQPVYSLNLVNDIFLPDVEGYYHDYRIVQVEHTDKVIEGLRFIFVELPKFTPHTYNEKKMQVLWLRYLTEIDEQTRQVPQELLDNPETHKALVEVEESAFTADPDDSQTVATRTNAARFTGKILFIQSKFTISVGKPVSRTGTKIQKQMRQNNPVKSTHGTV